MLKQIYRVIILIGIFIAALSYFSRDIKEVVFDIDNTTVMENATFPLVTIKTGDNEINLLHGYSTNLDANKLRETVTPLGLNQDFEVLINQEDYDIKKLNYEVREFVDNVLIESDSISVFDEVDRQKKAKIKLKTELIPEKEYALKITLVTSGSKKMYFFQRIKVYENAYLKEKLDFIMDFHKSLFDKKKAQNIVKYLETSKESDDTTLAYVNIHSSFENISWGNLKPAILTEVVPSVIEIYRDTASVELSYFAEAEIAGRMERYRVTEFYRIRYAPDRMYLLNYERRMESVFDIKLASVSKSELKLGITSNQEVPYKGGEDNTKLAFVRDHELWFYNFLTNEAIRVFTFHQDNTEFIRDYYDQHDIRILNMDAEGNFDFVVYGYMNRGQYEGRVAVILYHFYRSENRIEELVYIPVEEPYQMLKENLSDLSYVNNKEVFYFHIYNTIYSYNLITRQLSEIATDVDKNHIIVLKDTSYVAWQESSDPKQAKNICILDMETGEINKISAPQGYNIRLMDMIDSNIIYGYVKESDIASMIDGSIIAPLGSVEIASVDKKVLKKYSKSGYYVSGVDVKDNVIELRRVEKVENGGRAVYQVTSPDYIMNQVKEKAKYIQVTSRVTDQALTEYYLTLPKIFIMNEIPKIKTTVSTVITQDPTVRLTTDSQKLLYYYPYLSGRIAGAYENASDAIAYARDGIGTVLNSRQQIVWERGIRATNKVISEFENMNRQVDSEDTMESCLKLLLSYQKVSVSKEQLSIKNQSAYDVLKKYSKYTPIRLTGITLDDALYYVSKGRPVIAMKDTKNAVIIYGYDTFNIFVLDPASSQVRKMGIQDSAKLFEAAGNVFLSYLE